MSDLTNIARALCAAHYADRFKKQTDDPHVPANVDANWQSFIYQAGTALAAISTPPPVIREALSEETAGAIVEEIFKDLRDRRFLKWLFDRHGDANLIGRFDNGEELRGLDLEVQDDIKSAWNAIIRKEVDRHG